MAYLVPLIKSNKLRIFRFTLAIFLNSFVKNANIHFNSFKMKELRSIINLSSSPVF